MPLIPAHSHGSQFVSSILIKANPQVIVLTCIYNLHHALVQHSLGGKELGIGEQPCVVGSLGAATVRADEARLQKQAAPSPTGFT